MALFLVTSLADEPFDGGETPAVPDGAGLSLREAIGLANADPASGDQIEFAPGLTGGTLTLTGGQLEPHGDVEIDGDIDGDGTFDITIDADGASRAFFIDGSVVATAATLNGLRVTDGFALPGSAVLAVGPNGDPTGTLVISDSRFDGNTAAAVPSAEDPGLFLFGGPPTIAVATTNATLDNVEIVGNDGAGFAISGQGGFIRPQADISDTHAGNNTGEGLLLSYQARLFVSDSMVSDNGGRGVSFANEGGGAVTGSTISGNDDSGVYLGFNLSVDIVGSSITGNGFMTKGGGILSSYADLNLVDSIVSDNTATVGGGIYWDSYVGTLWVNGGEISGNSASRGAGIYLKSGYLSVGEGSFDFDPAPVTISDNAASRVGGGVHIVFAGGYSYHDIARLADVTISGNIAGAGAGIYTTAPVDPTADPILTITNGTIAENIASVGQGGGLLNRGANLELVNTTVADNMAARGGGLSNTGFLATGDLELTNSVVIGNEASDFGDDIEGTATLIGGNILGDTFSIDGAPVAAGIVRDDVLDGPLGDNGGGIETIRLVNDPANPALDSADDALAPGADARGLPRPFDVPGVANNGANASDLGAFEFQESDTLIAFAEFGMFSGLTDQEETVFLGQTFDNPVVIAQPLSFQGQQAAAVRITDIQADSFSFEIQEPSNETSGHVPEDVSWLVIEAGTWRMPGGFFVEAGTIQTDFLAPDNFESVGFEHSFDSSPVVLSQVQTDIGGDWVVTRQREIGSDGFEVAMQEEEALGGFHVVETLGYVALDAGQTTNSGRDLDIDSVDGFDFQFSNLGFIDLEDDPVFLASLSSFNGDNPATLRYDNLSATGVDVRVQEDRSLDEETFHVEETIDFVAIEGPSGSLVGFDIV